MKAYIGIDPGQDGAVAMICDYAQVNFCYGSIISEGAIEILERTETPFAFDKKVKAIKNWDNTDLCPLEKLTLKTENSAEGIKMMKDFLSCS
ncbi:MAG: DUF1893 domain-containing protein [Halanaerobiales bacterium]